MTRTLAKAATSVWRVLRRSAATTAPTAVSHEMRKAMSDMVESSNQRHTGAAGVQFSMTFNDVVSTDDHILLYVLYF